MKLVISVVLSFASSHKGQGIKRAKLIRAGFYKEPIPSHNSKQVSFTSMADEFEASIFVEDKKKRKRRGPRLTGISKQRRLANARERKRVQTLNEKIEVLKSLLPLSPHDKKPTKTEVIWLAAEYIDELTRMLHEAQSKDNFEGDSLLDFDTLLGVDIENLFELDGKCGTIDP